MYVKKYLYTMMFNTSALCMPLIIQIIVPKKTFIHFFFFFVKLRFSFWFKGRHHKMSVHKICLPVWLTGTGWGTFKHLAVLTSSTHNHTGIHQVLYILLICLPFSAKFEKPDENSDWNFPPKYIIKCKYDCLYLAKKM